MEFRRAAVASGIGNRDFLAGQQIGEERRELAMVQLEPQRVIDAY